MRRSWLLLLVALVLYALLLMVVGTFVVAFIVVPAFPLDLNFYDLADLFLELQETMVEIIEEGLWWWWCCIPALVVVLTQLIFVIPLLAPELQGQSGGRSMVFSLIVGAGVAAMLTLGMTLGLLELAGFLENGVVNGPVVVVTLAVLLVSWIAWTFLFFMFTRNSRRPAWLERLVGVLMAGTILETLAIIPVDIMVRRRTNCYCDTGTFYTLLIAAWAAMWLAGPGVLVLYTRRRRRRGRTHCLRCGYARGPSPKDRCPECGASWR